VQVIPARVVGCIIGTYPRKSLNGKPSKVNRKKNQLRASRRVILVIAFRFLNAKILTNYRRPADLTFTSSNVKISKRSFSTDHDDSSKIDISNTGNAAGKIINANLELQNLKRSERQDPERRNGNTSIDRPTKIVDKAIVRGGKSSPLQTLQQRFKVLGHVSRGVRYFDFRPNSRSEYLYR